MSTRKAALLSAEAVWYGLGFAGACFILGALAASYATGWGWLRLFGF